MPLCWFRWCSLHVRRGLWQIAARRIASFAHHRLTSGRCRALLASHESPGVRPASPIWKPISLLPESHDLSSVEWEI